MVYGRYLYIYEYVGTYSETLGLFISSKIVRSSYYIEYCVHTTRLSRLQYIYDVWCFIRFYFVFLSWQLQ